MSKIQQKLVQVLSDKKRIIGVTPPTLKRWKEGTTSPSIHKFEKTLKENDIELPFFFDGKIESLVEYNKQVGEKMGFKIQIIFES